MSSIPERRVQAQSLQLINKDGNIVQLELDTFVQTSGLHECGISYAVVAIIGPQSSGKSTLLNHLFGTQFQELEASNGRNQTTQGVWLARATNIDPCTIVMDVEGTDGKERASAGEDAFEKRSALFALATSDILVINMWEKDIGLENAGNRPLLTTLFEVMMKRLSQDRRRTLMFVIRDASPKTPSDKIQKLVMDDIQKIWESATKSNAQLTQYFNVRVVRLPNFELQEELFKEQVSELRKLFNNSTQEGGLVAGRKGIVAGSAWATTVQEVWKSVKENKYLDMPILKDLIANRKCQLIVNEQLDSWSKDTEWNDLEKTAEKGSVPDFWMRLSALFVKHLSAYDAETAHFDPEVKKKRRAKLIKGALDMVEPAYKAAISNKWEDTLRKFQSDAKVVAKAGDHEAFVKMVLSVLADFDNGCSGFTVSEESVSKEIQSFAIEHRKDRIKDMQICVSNFTRKYFKESTLSSAWKMLRAVIGDVIDFILD